MVGGVISFVVFFTGGCVAAADILTVESREQNTEATLLWSLWKACLKVLTTSADPW